MKTGQIQVGSVAYHIAHSIANNQQFFVVEKDIHQAQLTTELLQCYLPDANIHLFPDRETLPFDSLSPPPECTSRRLQILRDLGTNQPLIVVAACSTVMHYLPPKQWLIDAHFSYQVGDRLDMQQLAQRLSHSGYQAVATVQQPGEFAIRGALFDLYPMGSDLPFRLDFFDDSIESIRLFDPENQRTIETRDHISLLPASEVQLEQDNISQFRQKFYHSFPNKLHSAAYSSVSEGQLFAGIEYFLPWIHTLPLSTIWDYLHDACQVVLCPSVKRSATEFQRVYRQRYKNLQSFSSPSPTPDSVFLSTDTLLDRAQTAHWLLTEKSEENAQLLTLPKACLDGFLTPQNLMRHKPNQIICTVESARYAEHCIRELGQTGLVAQLVDNWRQALEMNVSQHGVAVIVAAVERGFFDAKAGRYVVSHFELFGTQAISNQQDGSTKRAVHADFQGSLHDISQMHIGAPVVHIEYGIGRYQGLHTLDVANGQQQDFICVQYAEGESLYLPITNIDVLSPYMGNADMAPLHNLTAKKNWKKECEKAQKRVEDVAAELLSVYARRETSNIKAFKTDDRYQRFQEEIPFMLTDDQQKAISEVLDDLAQSKPMDRLICGDVGFGKTEVALHAAFVTALSGKQVSILVPTTLLANQHYQTFQDRFSKWPLRIGIVSRLQGKDKQKTTLEQLENGSLDVIIGTHKLLQKGINFKDLGLLIIDEEHRFGVKQKEQFKALRSDVNVLTMTATPIPRTLNMAFADLRDMSLITSPPPGRIPIRTFVRGWDSALIKEAAEREIQRGGQLFFIHNKVQSIHAMKRDLEMIVPKANIAIAHGQMPEREIEQIMEQFYHQQFHILLCTTIVETGLDVANANTIIINRADAFGLAQLHQLRGRVGRSSHQAYAYLLVPESGAITPHARKRLEAIEQAQDLGAGFQLAIEDMEIRGAGELLGDQQKGHMQKIGFNLYMQMLAKAIEQITGKLDTHVSREWGDTINCEINLGFNARIPEEYIADIPTRLRFYHRMHKSQSVEALNNLRFELLDRFGILPEVLENLITIHKIRQQSSKIGIVKLDAHSESAFLQIQATKTV